MNSTQFHAFFMFKILWGLGKVNLEVDSKYLLID